MKVILHCRRNLELSENIGGKNPQQTIPKGIFFKIMEIINFLFGYCDCFFKLFVFLYFDEYIVFLNITIMRKKLQFLKYSKNE